MQSFKAIFALALCALVYAQLAMAQVRFGAQGAEAEPNREQQWLVPSPDPDTAAHAVLFRPAGDGPFRLAVIAHASTQNVLRRAQMPQPEYRALAAWLVARGFAVLVPERLGHGATGGRYLEDQGGCDEADYSPVGRATAGEIAAALSYLREQSFIRQDGAVVLGHSAGGWARWRSRGRIGLMSQPSLHLHRDAVATPTTSPIRSARRIRWSQRPPNSAKLRACR
jgi:hypothetical protein